MQSMQVVLLLASLEKKLNWIELKGNNTNVSFVELEQTFFESVFNCLQNWFEQINQIKKYEVSTILLV